MVSTTERPGPRPSGSRWPGARRRPSPRRPGDGPLLARALRRERGRRRGSRGEAGAAALTAWLCRAAPGWCGFDLDPTTARASYRVVQASTKPSGTGVSGARGVIFDFGGVLIDMRGTSRRAWKTRTVGPVTPSSRLCTGRRPGRRSSVAEATSPRGDRRHRLLEERAGRLPAPRRLGGCPSVDPREHPAGPAASPREPHRHSLERRSESAGAPPRARDSRSLRTVISSAEEGLAKPDPEIYRRAAARLGLPPAACVFVDDDEATSARPRSSGCRASLPVDRGQDLTALLAAVGVSA